MNLQKALNNLQYIQNLTSNPAISNVINIQSTILTSPQLSNLQTILQAHQHIDSTITPNIIKALNSYTQIIASLSSHQFDITTTYVSSNASEKCTDISNDILNDIDDINLPDDLVSSKDTVMDLSTSKNKLTWEQVLTIIGFILSVITFVQSQYPNQQLSNIENSIQELIELQSNELAILSNQEIE